MWDRKLLAEALMGPPASVNPLLARGGNRRKIGVRAIHTDSGEPIFFARKAQRAPGFKWLAGMAQAAFEAKGRYTHAARIRFRQ